MEVLYQLASHYEQRGIYERARHYALRQVDLESWCEKAHQQLMCALASGGQRSAALAQYETCRGILAQELGVEPAAETRALYDQIRSGDPECSRIPRHNLPAQPTAFIGREVELAQITELLAQADCRLLTLVGPGGIGKTRLALQAAANEIGMFRDGVFFVPFSAVSSPDYMATTWAQALQLSFQGGTDPKVNLLDYVREKEMLLVLDNLEHLLSPSTLNMERTKGEDTHRPNAGGAELLAEILQKAPGITLLVTSRERLNLRWEWLFEVHGLEFPPAGVTDATEHYCAVQLFVQSARRVQPNLALEKEMPSIVRICRFLEGMPLGIELAAAWAQTFACHEIAQKIEGNLSFLAFPLQDLPERHRSLQAVFDHSWNMLSEEEKSAFGKLSVFRGGFREQAAQRAADVSLPLLLALTRKSLLRRDIATGRYEMLKVVREYAEEKLAESPQEQVKAHDLHCEYYAEFLHQRENHLKGERQKEALKEIGEEIENVRASWQWAIVYGKEETIGISLESLHLFYGTCGWYQEGQEMFENAVERLRGASGPQGELSEGKSILLGKILTRLGQFYETLARFEKARELSQASLDILRRLGARREMPLSLNNLGSAAWRLGEYAEARRLYQASLEIYREDHNRRGTAACLFRLGIPAMYLGEHAEAKQLFLESLAIYQEIGDRYGVACCLEYLGNLATGLGEHAEARQLFQASFSICQELDYRPGLACCLVDLGLVAHRLKEHAQAKRLSEEGIAIYKEVNDQMGVADGLINLGRVAEALGEYGEAQRLYQESLATYQEVKDPHAMVRGLNDLGVALCALGEYQKAMQCFHAALETAAYTRLVPKILETMAGIAVLLAKEGKLEKAIELVACVLHHSASEVDAKSRAMLLLSELGPQLAPQTFRMALERGKTIDLEYFTRAYGAVLPLDMVGNSGHA
jgi:predicted ATPase